MTRKVSPKKSEPWSSAAARRLLSMAGQVSSVEEAVQVIVGTYLSGVRCPPTDLDAVAARANVGEVCGEDLPVSGELRREGRRLKIVYSSDLSAPRRRFTIAHEIGHAIFETSGRNPPRTGDELERLCDMIASEILMPKDIFLNLTEAVPSVRDLLDVAQLFKTSLEAAGRRYAALKKVVVFYVDEEKVSWSTGTVRRGSLQFADYSLRSAVARALDGEAHEDTVYMPSEQRRGEWKLECQTLGGRRALCVLRPPISVLSQPKPSYDLRDAR